MNENQQRALWATALRNLADAIEHTNCLIPTSVDVWSQGVEPVVLFEHADTACPRSLQIHHEGSSGLASVNIPTGELLDLDLTWIVQTDKLTPADIVGIDTHNEVCMRGQEGDATCAAPNGASPDFIPSGLNDTSEN